MKRKTAPGHNSIILRMVLAGMFVFMLGMSLPANAENIALQGSAPANEASFDTGAPPAGADDVSENAAGNADDIASADSSDAPLPEGAKPTPEDTANSADAAEGADATDIPLVAPDAETQQDVKDTPEPEEEAISETVVAQVTHEGETQSFDTFEAAIDAVNASTGSGIELAIMQNVTQESAVAITTTTPVTIRSSAAAGAPFAIVRGGSFAGITIEDGASVACENLIYDGGAEWGGGADATLGRGTAASGVTSAPSAFVVKGALSFGGGMVLRNAHTGSSSSAANTLSALSVEAQGTFTLDGGAVRDCANTQGSGAAVSVNGSGSQFLMQSGEIVSCEAAGAGGALALVGGSARIEGGQIHHNRAGAQESTGGGALFIGRDQAATVSFVLAGGTLDNNHSVGNGAAVVVAGAQTTNTTAEFLGGSVVNNTNDGGNVAGVSVHNPTAEDASQGTRIVLSADFTCMDNMAGDTQANFHMSDAASQFVPAIPASYDEAKGTFAHATSFDTSSDVEGQRLSYSVEDDQLFLLYNKAYVANNSFFYADAFAGTKQNLMAKPVFDVGNSGSWHLEWASTPVAVVYDGGANPYSPTYTTLGAAVDAVNALNATISACIGLLVPEVETDRARYDLKSLSGAPMAISTDDSLTFQGVTSKIVQRVDRDPSATGGLFVFHDAMNFMYVDFDGGGDKGFAGGNVFMAVGAQTKFMHGHSTISNVESHSGSVGSPRSVIALSNGAQLDMYGGIMTDCFKNIDWNQDMVAGIGVQGVATSIMLEGSAVISQSKFSCGAIYINGAANTTTIKSSTISNNTIDGTKSGQDGIICIDNPAAPIALAFYDSLINDNSVNGSVPAVLSVGKYDVPHTVEFIRYPDFINNKDASGKEVGISSSPKMTFSFTAKNLYWIAKYPVVFQGYKTGTSSDDLTHLQNACLMIEVPDFSGPIYTADGSYRWRIADNPSLIPFSKISPISNQNAIYWGEPMAEIQVTQTIDAPSLEAEVFLLKFTHQETGRDYFITLRIAAGSTSQTATLSVPTGNYTAQDESTSKTIWRYSPSAPQAVFADPTVAAPPQVTFNSTLQTSQWLSDRQYVPNNMQ